MRHHHFRVENINQNLVLSAGSGLDDIQYYDEVCVCLCVTKNDHFGLVTMMMMYCALMTGVRKRRECADS